MSGGGKPRSIEDDLAQIRQRTIDEDLADVRKQAAPGPTLSHTKPDEPLPFLTRVGEPIARHAANIAQGVPGMRAVESAVGALTSGQSFGVARDQLDAETKQIGGPLRFAEQAVGGIPAMALLGPASRVLGAGANALREVPVVGKALAAVPSWLASGTPTASGALLGAAQEAASADEESGLARLGKTLGGGALGAATGKAFDLGAAALRVGNAENASQNVLDQARGIMSQRAKVGGVNATKAALEDAIAPPPTSVVTDEVGPVAEGFAPNRHATAEQLAYRSERLGAAPQPPLSNPAVEQAKSLIADANKRVAVLEGDIVERGRDVAATERGMDAVFAADKGIPGSQATSSSRAAILRDISNMTERQREKFAEGLAGNAPLSFRSPLKNIGTLNRVADFTRAAKPGSDRITTGTLAALLAALQ